LLGIVDRPKQGEMDGKAEPERLRNLQSFQVYLLRYALLNFPNAKKIIYSTCSLYPEENEQVIDEVLTNIGNAYRLIPARHMLGDKWINFSSEEYNCKDKCLYSRPNVDLCNGFFVAVFERNFNVTLPTCKRKGGNVNLSDNVNFNVNLDMDKDDKKISLKRKKRGKRKNKKEISSMNEETKMSEDAERGKSSKKRRLEHENITQINVDQETTKNDDYVEIEMK
jgi:putative methyltransferase